MQTKPVLHQALVGPILEHAVTVWGYHHQSHIYKLEAVYTKESSQIVKINTSTGHAKYLQNVAETVVANITTCSAEIISRLFIILCIYSQHHHLLIPIMHILYIQEVVF